ncbi:MAG: hypothetical protein CMJ70_27300 [Planctomycetaceae bacterium]|nr:hypothetical protein [Planctomycetaceae bacterium]HAA72689.1 hypothetical protein [Planctomycetaceae bacterium]
MLRERILTIHVMLIMVFTRPLSNLSGVYENISFISKIESEKTQAVKANPSGLALLLTGVAA